MFDVLLFHLREGRLSSKKQAVDCSSEQEDMLSAGFWAVDKHPIEL